MSETKKITVKVPTELLKEAQKVTGAGISETVNRGLPHGEWGANFYD